ncbi:hypothetical protein [Prochlorococcus marinus]|uniref:hypothetical protein n=1 Tax=Prochlorococcus marinus TaxID=1219 RepID=UPI0022B51261|nr:hypothetical protein [Prochlorococcus marinus]
MHGLFARRGLYICERASAIFRNLLFRSFFILLTRCIASRGRAGGSYPAGGNPTFLGHPGIFTCDGTSGQYGEFYCETSEHPNMCDSWGIVYDLIN